MDNHVSLTRFPLLSPNKNNLKFKHTCAVINHQPVRFRCISGVISWLTFAVSSFFFSSFFFFYSLTVLPLPQSIQCTWVSKFEQFPNLWTLLLSAVGVMWRWESDRESDSDSENRARDHILPVGKEQRVTSFSPIASSGLFLVLLS